VLPTVEEMLERIGAGADAAVAEELPHNRWLSPGVWRVRTGAGRLAVLKYTRSDRSPGATPTEAHWTARVQLPRLEQTVSASNLTRLHHPIRMARGSGWGRAAGSRGREWPGSTGLPER